jgi:hypothetical protein
MHLKQTERRIFSTGGLAKHLNAHDPIYHAQVFPPLKRRERLSNFGVSR